MKRIRKIICFLLILCFCAQTPITAFAAETESNKPVINVTYKIKDFKAVVTINIESQYKIESLRYIYGNVERASNPVWETHGQLITGENQITLDEMGVYSFKAVDVKGNYSVILVDIESEFNAMWISYLEFKSTGYTKKEFETQINTMFDKVEAMGMNAVVVHVRPFGDAMYPSKYFPWSKYVSGTQGKDPGFDPLEIMVAAAHKRGLQFHAWLNPYRVTLNNTDVTNLATKNYARKWLTDTSTSNDRNIISFNNNLYYNPAKTAVRTLIKNGVLEIVQNYDVDGIHFDDYFYPTLGSKYETVFDAQEYQEYVTKAKEDGVKNILSIANWRRRNVNYLVKGVYSIIKEMDESVVFGISPGGFIDTLLMDDRYFTDIKTWLSKPGYVDYICPQVYWSFEHKTYPFDKTVERWAALCTNPDVNLYIGIPAYKAGSKEEAQFYNNSNILVDMIEFCRNTKKVSGYLFYRYDYFQSSVTKKAVNKLINLLNEN